MTVEAPPSSSMKIVASRDELARALGVVGRAVSARISVQILAGILLRAGEGRLTVAATDMEMSLRASLDADIEGEGSVVVPGRLLVDIVRLLPPGEVVLTHEADAATLELTCGTGSYRLNTYRADDFPRLPELEPSTLVSVSREALLDTIAKVARAASRDESRPVLTGILVRLEGAGIVMAATDSYRLAVKETALEQEHRRRLRGDRARPGPRRARPYRARGERRRDRHRRSGEPGGVRRRGRRPHRETDRRAVSELPPAAAGELRGRDQRPARGAARRGTACQRYGPAQRAAPAAVRGRRAHDSGAVPGCR